MSSRTLYIPVSGDKSLELITQVSSEDLLVPSLGVNGLDKNGNRKIKPVAEVADLILKKDFRYGKVFIKSRTMFLYVAGNGYYYQIDFKEVQHIVHKILISNLGYLATVRLASQTAEELISQCNTTFGMPKIDNRFVVLNNKTFDLH